MLMVAAGCDKPAETAEVKHRTTLANKPNVVFLLFGDRTDPRLLPVATIIEGQVNTISLDEDGWRQFDYLYFRPKTQLSLYRDGQPAGDISVRRGMWAGRGPLYKLPRCRALKPLAAVNPPEGDFREVMVELMATSQPLAISPSRRPMPKGTLDSARTLANRVAQVEGLTRNARAELDLSVNALKTGASRWPTLSASFMERGGGLHGHPRHLLILADSIEGGYTPTYVHSAEDSMPEFRRVIDHADITGDGVDEVLMEGWKNGGDSFLLFLRFSNGKWREMARGETSWCADEQRHS